MSSTARVTPPIIRARDRLGLTIFLAVSLHALVLLGVSFQFLAKPKQQIINTLDITLVSTRSDKAPEKADYLAQENREGRGNTTERVRPKSPDVDPSVADTPGTGKTTQPSASPDRPEISDRTVVTTIEKKDPAVHAEQKPPAITHDTPSLAEIMRRSKDIAQLEAEVENTSLAYSQRPDPKYLTAATQKFQDAEYLASWTRKVERIGNLNYPDEARRKKLTGSLQLDVSLKPDGSLLGIRLLQSSGYKVLDDAAVRIVRLAAPFARIPRDVLGDRNELRIVRTWVFSVGNQLSSH